MEPLLNIMVIQIMVDTPAGILATRMEAVWTATRSPLSIKLAIWEVAMLCRVFS
jgi:hypothetical protein